MRINHNKVISFLIVVVLALQIAVPGFASELTNAENALQANTIVEGRLVQNICDDWKFTSESTDASAVDYNDQSWEAVTIPHTWNAEDGADGGGNYRRGVSWYRKSIPWQDEFAGRKVYIEFLGSSLKTDIYVNAKHLGTHKGGYTAFRFDITDAMVQGQPTSIAVKVDNSRQSEIAPLGGDFTIFGGIYREVSLIVTDPVHVDTMDYGSSGLYLTQSSVSNTSADLEVRSNIVNDSSEAKTVQVSATLKDADGNEVKTQSQSLVIPAEGQGTFLQEMAIANPHLWHGVEDPYLYSVELNVSIDGTIVDHVSERIGLRYFTVDREKGFFLNGESYPLRGVSRHQDGYDVTGETYLGSALTKAEQERDMEIMLEMGVNYVRLAHYPHHAYFYQLCDEYGLISWAEIPIVGGTTNSNDFTEVTKQQLVEMIRQQYNRSSVCFWGLTNEITPSSYVISLIRELNDLAHAEDSTRLTTLAAVGTSLTSAAGLESDLVGWNIYPNWYYENTVEDMMNERFYSDDPRPISLSEYGAGSNILQHEDPPVFSIGQSRGQWHPEEYQSIWHEDALRAIKELDYLWSTAVWNMFDFGSDGRNEGGQQGINDKGLVTIDRLTKKDVFYLYKANWNPTDYFTHINSSRFDPREDEQVTVKVYSNCDTVDLVVNGTSYGTKNNDGLGVFQWPDIPLVLGENTVTATAVQNGETYTDEIVWERVLGTSTTLNSISDKFVVDNPNQQITLLTSVTVEELKESLVGVNGTTWVLQDENGQPVTDDTLEILMEMKVTATSQNGETQTEYTFATRNLAGNKEVTASSELNDFPASAAVDMNGSTYWSANRGATGWITVDLGDSYILNDIVIDWYNNSDSPRTYRYTVQVSEDGEEYVVAVDRSANTTATDADTRRVIIQDTMDDIVGRYIKINVTGGASGMTCIEISEIVVNGWRMVSDLYEIDHDQKLIVVPELPPGEELTWEEFERNLTVEGTHRECTNETGAYYVMEDDKWIVIDSNGNENVYTIHFEAGQGDIPVESIDLNAGSLNMLSIGNTLELNPTILPENATDQSVTYTSNNPNVASVDEDGVVTAHKTGTALITATASSGKVSKTTVRVTY